MKAIEIFQVLIHAVLAVFGVAARELRFKDERKLVMSRLISNAIVASFGATIVYFIASMSNLPPEIGYISAGLVGWAGPQIIDKLFEKHPGMFDNDDLSKVSENDKANGESSAESHG